MRHNLENGVSADFLDGYLFRLIQELLEREGVEESGLQEYYARRIRSRFGGLLDYEGALAAYLLSQLGDRRILHAGIGIGTLDVLLAANGMRVAGVERDLARLRCAGLVRDALCRLWPEIADRYELIEGYFPDAVGRAWTGSDVIVVFTNVIAGWSAALTGQVITALPRFGAAVVELRQFGNFREDAAERQELFDRIAATARSAERLPDMPGDSDFAYFVFQR